MNEYFIVNFYQKREVVINDTPSGYFTGDVISIEPGTHTISLAQPNDFSPSEQNINLSDTSPLSPEHINFVEV